MMMRQAAKEAGDNLLAKITVDLLDEHTSPAEAAEIAGNADLATCFTITQ